MNRKIPSQTRYQTSVDFFVWLTWYKYKVEPMDVIMLRCRCHCKDFSAWDLIGLSFERPILDHHAKAHIHEIRRISYGFQVKSGRFHTDFMKSGGFCTDFTHEIHQISHMKSTGFQVWNPPDFTHDFEDQLPGMVSPMFLELSQNISSILWLKIEISKNP